MGQIIGNSGIVVTEATSNTGKRPSHKGYSVQAKKYVPNNGLILNNVYLPEEIIAFILSLVKPDDLIKNCTLVCTKWHALIEEDVWKMKADRDLPISFRKRLPNIVYKSLCLNFWHNSNLLKNNSGQMIESHRPQVLQHWLKTENGGDGWIIESPPTGVPRPTDATYEEPTHCFVSSYGVCKKSQKIYLKKIKCLPKILDEYEPEITVSEWYAARWDCGSIYEIEVSLMNEKSEILQKYTERKELRDWQDGWKEVSHTFKNYGPGLRYIQFVHMGRDTQFWAGFYGSKMANAKVEINALSISSPILEDDDLDTDII